jgi:DUF4097 and DUF4098 domain-containing protein YvlB
VSVIVHEAKALEVHEAKALKAAKWDQSRCRFEAQREFSQAVGSGDMLQLRAGSGSLEVVGVEGLREVRAVGRACASHEEFLEEIQLASEAGGGALRLETRHPDLSDWRGGGNRYAYLDLRVEVPAGMEAEVEDGSGEATLSQLGSLSIRDGSGELAIQDIWGDLMVRDGSGELEIRGVQGSARIGDSSGEIVLEDVGQDAEIEDSSGEIEVRMVGGSLTLSDSSGEIDVEDVRGTVRVVRDGSGGIRVEGVGGDFVVERDGSGDIRHSGVEGRVDIPRKKGER